MKPFKFFKGVTDLESDRLAHIAEEVARVTRSIDYVGAEYVQVQHTNRPVEENYFMGFSMDDCLLAVLRYKIDRNLPLDGDTDLSQVNRPFMNVFLRIVNTRRWGSGTTGFEMTEIDYTIIEVNNQSYNYTYRTTTDQLMYTLTYDRL